MNPMSMSVAVGVLGAALGACGAAPEGGTASMRPGADGAAGSAPSGGQPGSSSAGPPGQCAPGVPTTSQIPRLLNRQYDAVVRDLLGITGVGSDRKPPSQLLVADSDGPLTPDSWRIYQDVGNQIAHTVMTGPSKGKFIACDPAANGCLEQTIRTFGRKAFRRPLTEAEVARFLKLGQTMPAGTPDEVAETTLYAFLVSPSFLMLPELSAAPESMPSTFKLSSHELATRLSFLLWGSLPDDALDAAADADQLQTKEQKHPHVAR